MTTSGSTMADCPILVWNLSLNREYTLEVCCLEYNACYNVVKECAPHVNIKYEPKEPDTFRLAITQMLPLLMMRHRRIPRAKWRDCASSNGKHWIEQLPDDMPPEKFLFSMIGYHLEYSGSLCAMAMTQGIQRKVVNIGLGIKQLSVDPAGSSIDDYVTSIQHKLTAKELEQVTADLTPAAVLRRACTTLALKQAYLNAIGQPLGFDFSRLEFNVPAQTAQGDGHPLLGWEFRLYTVTLGVARRDQLVNEQYVCVTAFFRATAESKFIWYRDSKELESWVQFINIDQMLKVIPKLTA
ncbi:hypothetical protein C8J56DRAFT_1015989 [Mycena floridula]|nr:hypothetical protein C8J56DRAFT_1015989 [Mycena floridula]